MADKSALRFLQLEGECVDESAYLCTHVEFLDCNVVDNVFWLVALIERCLELCFGFFVETIVKLWPFEAEGHSCKL